NQMLIQALGVRFQKQVFDVMDFSKAFAASRLHVLSVPPGEPFSRLDLSAVKNSHRKTTLKYPMGGVDTFISAQFSRDQKGYLSVWAPESVLAFFNVEKLLDKDGIVAVRGKIYYVKLSPNIFDKLGSKIIIENQMNSREKYSFKVRDLLKAVYETGYAVNFPDRAYRMAYYDEVTEKGGRVVLNPNQQMLVFGTHQSKDDYPTYWIDPNTIPSDGVAVYTFYNGKKVGLRKLDNILEIYNNPS
ncbi:MAG: hypothetical protein HY400_01105, partial [Elusimicrobia bacterium]|nr:hypothetical protein [Elusimicrobiota bacterium]